jgi:hypothetical protein
VVDAFAFLPELSSAWRVSPSVPAYTVDQMRGPVTGLCRWPAKLGA